MKNGCVLSVEHEPVTNKKEKGKERNVGTISTHLSVKRQSSAKICKSVSDHPNAWELKYVLNTQASNKELLEFELELFDLELLLGK